MDSKEKSGAPTAPPSAKRREFTLEENRNYFLNPSGPQPPGLAESIAAHHAFMAMSAEEEAALIAKRSQERLVRELQWARDNPSPMKKKRRSLALRRTPVSARVASNEPATYVNLSGTTETPSEVQAVGAEAPELTATKANEQESDAAVIATLHAMSAEQAMSAEEVSLSVCDEAAAPARPRETTALAPFFTGRHVPTYINGIRTTEWHADWVEPEPSPTRTLRAPRTKPGKPPPVSRQLQRARWPFDIVEVASNFNPAGITFSYLKPSGRLCGCKKLCVYPTCWNASNFLFCTGNSCSFAGMCGNSRLLWEGLRLFRRAGEYIVITTTEIPAGYAIGQYLGRLSYETNKKGERQPNEGYRLHLHADREKWGQAVTVCINAQAHGNILRFCNHHCNATTRFHEVGYGRLRTIVAVTTRKLPAGSEVTVDYGEDRWFPCTCDLCATSQPSEADKQEQILDAAFALGLSTSLSLSAGVDDSGEDAQDDSDY